MAGIELPERYRDVEPIGAGAMASVHRAFDSELGRVVAIKLLSERYAADPEIRERFRREAQTAARLTGAPHTVGVLDVGLAGERPYIVLEYVGGGSFADSLADGRPSTGDALTWIEQAGEALDAAHARGVVHRDVKPANLLLDEAGGVRIADFGIARAIDDATITSTGTVLGSAGYLSPEQARGDPATEASDRYALAVVAYELLSGRRPFERESATAEVLAHVHAAPPVFSADSPSDVDRVFERALAKDPARRYVSCAAFAAALRRAVAGAGVTIPLGGTAVIPVNARPGRRRLLAGALAGALAAAGIAAALGLTADRGSGRAAATTRVTVRETVTETVAAPPRTVRVPAAPQLIEAHGPGRAKPDDGHRHGHGPRREH